jgi:TrmH family RNA methyltransferase
MKSNEPFKYDGGLVLALDAINDPGNLGTILRTADWYGVSGIIASRNTCEFYNPKVISASKGSFSRIPFYYMELHDFVPQMGIPVLAADLTGENVHEFSFPRDVCLLLGNEAHGISPDLEGLIKSRIHIPRFGNGESLNVGIAAAVMMDNYSRTS